MAGASSVPSTSSDPSFTSAYWRPLRYRSGLGGWIQEAMNHVIRNELQTLNSVQHVEAAEK